ncbi:MAG: 2-hydroxyacid dehydrogenase, partial [Mesorhizobium sp.]
MQRPHILQVGPYPAWDEVPLNEAFVVHRYFAAEDKPSFLADVGPQALEVVSVYGVGFDAVDLSACRERGVRVTNTPDVLTNDVADLGIAMMLCLSRGMIGAERWVRDGSWASKGLYTLKRRVWGRRAGVLGLGRIG